MKQDEDLMVRCYDRDGNEVLVLKSEYRKKVLPGQFEAAGDDPEKLYDAIVMALRNGFFEECVEAARRLCRIDTDRERAAVILGIALMKNGQLEAAESVFESYLEKFGDSGVVLTNLAKVIAEKGDEGKAYQTLWRGLAVDPNQENGLQWWGAIHHERGGDKAFVNAMEKLAGIEGSWRAQLWLARRHLEQADLPKARELYEYVLGLASNNGDALMMICGDLGNKGYLKEALELVLPVYEPEKHGAFAGLNLIRACLQLRDKNRGLELCQAVERLQTWDLKGYLDELRVQLKRL